MFSMLLKDKLKLIKKNGEIIEQIQGSVQKNKIYIMRGDILIEKDDIIERFMSNGGIETFQVINPNFYEKHNSISAHYQLEVVNSNNIKELKSKNNHSSHIYNNINVRNAGIISTGSNSTNIYNENNINKLIEEIKKLNLKDEKQIISDLEASKIDNEKAKVTLGSLLSKGSEVSSITSLIIEILSKINS
ncbi:hypothetical protein [Aliarcobacter cryaerophilus]|uniref:hypothetical protein n=1 Tax=Aliarcobacter cryaerophilus TaxID=28198 RepID=UPI0013DD9B35|nr:hypothetical protein [Aliarcobacter cryaerophilus]